jgi:predicted nucleic acid-binding protein
LRLVIDASVIVKWLLNDPDNESETELATELMHRILVGQLPALQPVHWLLEIGAVLARVSPATAEKDIALLQALEIPTDDSPVLLARACRLAVDLRQHLFDTLYHAVALENPDCTLITADERYLDSGAREGRIVRLTDWKTDLGVTHL